MTQEYQKVKGTFGPLWVWNEGKAICIRDEERQPVIEVWLNGASREERITTASVACEALNVYARIGKTARDLWDELEALKASVAEGQTK